MGILLNNDADRVVFVDIMEHIREQTVLGIFAKYILQDNPNGNVVSSIVASQSLEEIVSGTGGQH